ncbi:hypothetical protein HYH03_004714 [Edaphochlamys debaryana]|uniref:Peptidase M11 gametolysin domain-containing protein n=1 Tax=Edaphochlamys debaryana TaxID=47281 RepID=A0A835Y9A1_9CHLO|nr:hypothetical protein HYH03_004714 [Edaphochlamys debaryana]|eukprot:KAG2497123.1 hypothetical protein HYH03_004714 [Edaphochlamys debaryana]
MAAVLGAASPRPAPPPVAAFANGGANPITIVSVEYSSSAITGIRVRYGSQDTPWRGSTAGAFSRSLSVSSRDAVVAVEVRASGFVEGLRLTPSGGKSPQVLGLDGAGWVSATPCQGGTPRLLYISGIARDFLEQITFVQGPFGTGASGSAYAFDDTSYAAGGASPITLISAIYGTSTTLQDTTPLASIQVTYGSTLAPLRGSVVGGNAWQSFALGSGEFVTSAAVRLGSVVNGIRLTTSWGRRKVLGSDGADWLLATPCVPYAARLVYIKGIARAFLEQLTFVWDAFPPSPPPLPPTPPPRPPGPTPPPPVEVTKVIFGDTYGGEGAFGNYSFTEKPPSPEVQLTGLRLYMRNGWLYGVQVAFGGVWGPMRGGSNGTLAFELNQTAGEALTGALVIAVSGFVYRMILHTSAGRIVHVGSNTSAPHYVASPCPMGAYQLVAISGWLVNPGATMPPYIAQLSLTWRLVPSTGPSMIAAARSEVEGAGWQCPFGLASVIRKGPLTGAPECLAAAGQTACIQGECRALQLCAAVGSGPALQLPGQQLPGQVFGRVGCEGAASPANSSDYRLPSQWCPRAAGLLGLPPAPSAPLPIRVIALILDLCGWGPAMPVSDVEQSFYNDSYGLQSYWGAASWGQAVFNRSTSIIKNIRLPCTPADTNTCNYRGWIDSITRNATALGVPEVLSSVWAKVLIWPRPAPCSWLSLTSPSDGIVWLSADAVSPTQGRNLVFLKRELGMTLGLTPSGRGDPTKPSQSPDASDPLQYQLACQHCLYIAPHLLQLGWATPLASLASADIPPGVATGPITLPALAARKISPVVVYPDWLDLYGAVPMSEANPPNPMPVAPYNASALVLSYRLRMGQDEDISDEVNAAVSVHRASLLLGAVLDGRRRVGGSPWLEAVVSKGILAVLPTARLVVSVAAPGADPTVAVVRLCRFLVSQAECVMT